MHPLPGEYGNGMHALLGMGLVFVPLMLNCVRCDLQTSVLSTFSPAPRRSRVSKGGSLGIGALTSGIFM